MLRRLAGEPDGPAAAGRAAAGWFVALLTALGSQFVSAQPSMQTIRTNGPASNRLNVVVLSEGYTTNDLAQFLVDATNAVSTLLSHPPYRDYSNYVNAFAIQVASIESGSDHPDQPNGYRDTYFNSAYYGYLIEIPPGATGQGRIDALLQTFMPRCQLPILLVNDQTGGGSDGFDETAIADTGALAYEAYTGQPGILTHETGHVLANLGDEYTLAYPGYPDLEEPNTTRETNQALIKWRAWISPDTPIPSPDSVGDGIVGLFEGAHYHETGWYRPQLNCAMKSYGVPFCPVCSEALVLAIYRHVRPVDAFSPANTNLSVTTTQALAFNLVLLQPAANTLSVQWFTNGVPSPGATNASFTLFPKSLPNGTNWVRALVKDTTPLVRTDPTNLLSQTVTWTLNVSLSELRLDSPLWLGGGKFAFRVSGLAPNGFAIQSATSFPNWVSISTNYLVGGQFWCTNSGNSSTPRKFYRALALP